MFLKTNPELGSSWCPLKNQTGAASFCMFRDFHRIRLRRLLLHVVGALEEAPVRASPRAAQGEVQATIAVGLRSAERLAMGALRSLVVSF